MTNRLALPVLLVSGGLVFSPLALADIELGEGLALYGNVRGGYFNLRREDRDGSKDTREDWRVRVRAGLQWQPAERWTLAARFAGRYSTNQDDHSFALDWHATSPTGLALGEATLDEAYAAYQGDGWSLKVGRFQVSHELDGVAKKGLDRNDSPNTDITWTDGVQWQIDLAAGWQATVVADYNDREGPSNARHKPLDFSASNARLSGFAALENAEPWGVVVQRSFSVTYLPDALYARGLDGSSGDYSALAARTALQWPLGDNGSAFLLGLEAGHAFDTPRQATMGLPGSGDSDGTAWQVSFNLMNLVPGHSIGLVGSRADAGWLLSPDFIPNSEMVEVRYQWRVDKHQSFEARLRYREDLDKLLSVASERQDTDFYLRYTYKF